MKLKHAIQLKVGDTVTRKHRGTFEVISITAEYIRIKTEGGDNFGKYIIGRKYALTLETAKRIARDKKREKLARSALQGLLANPDSQTCDMRRNEIETYPERILWNKR